MKMNKRSTTFRRRRHDATAEVFLQAAEAAIARRGYERLTMRDLAASAGCAAGTVYLYFRGKREVVRAIAGRHGLRLLARVTAASAAATDPLEQLRRITESLAEYLIENRDFVRAFWASLQPRRERLAATMPPAVQRRWNEFWRQELRIIRQAQAQGTIRQDFSAEALQRFTHALLGGVVEALSDDATRLGKEELTRMLWSFQTGGIGCGRAGR